MIYENAIRVMQLEEVDEGRVVIPTRARNERAPSGQDGGILSLNSKDSSTALLAEARTFGRNDTCLLLSGSRKKLHDFQAEE
jgi:hypothetical protein